MAVRISLALYTTILWTSTTVTVFRTAFSVLTIFVSLATQIPRPFPVTTKPPICFVTIKSYITFYGIFTTKRMTELIFTRAIVRTRATISELRATHLAKEWYIFTLVIVFTSRATKLRPVSTVAEFGAAWSISRFAISVRMTFSAYNIVR